MKKNRRLSLIKSRKKFVSIFWIVLMLILTYFPIAYLAAYSFTESNVIGRWTGLSIALYVQMFTNAEIMAALGNSVLIGVVSSAFAAILGTLAAVGIFYMRKLPRAASNGLTQITMINADIVTAIAFMLFFLVIKVIPYGYATLITAHTMIGIPYVIMSVVPRLSQLNQHVYEAGLDLGANHNQTFLKVVMPQLIGGMIAGFALAFTISFDDFTISKWIRGDVETIPIYLYNNLKRGLVPVMRALSTFLLIAVTAILIIINVTQASKAKTQKNSGT